jgi:hypothetical protein
MRAWLTCARTHERLQCVNLKCTKPMQLVVIRSMFPANLEISERTHARSASTYVRTCMRVACPQT